MKTAPDIIQPLSSKPQPPVRPAEPQRILISFPVKPCGKPDEGGFLKQIGFQLAAPRAKAVHLAGDFTGWDTAPIRMSRSPAGIWQTRVALGPGKYRYRYLVETDNRPQAGLTRQLNLPFGTLYGEMEVS